MFVCLCRAVTTRMVEDAVRHGARTIEDVARRSGAGTVCGKCVEPIRSLLLEMQAVPRPAPVGPDRPAEEGKM